MPEFQHISALIVCSSLGLLYGQQAEEFVISGGKLNLWYLYSTKAFSPGYRQRQDTGPDGPWVEPL